MHKPPHSYGDCLRACIASLLEIEPHDVPHFYRDGDDERGLTEFKDFLHSEGYRPFYTVLQGTNTIDDIFAMMEGVNNGIEYLLFHMAGGDCDHVVICRDDKVIHDPALVRSNVRSATSQGVWVIVVLVPIKP